MTSIKNKKPYNVDDIADDMFFAEIKRMNDAGEQGGSKIIQVDENTAMLIYWRKCHWEYNTYPFIPITRAKS